MSWWAECFAYYVCAQAVVARESCVCWLHPIWGSRWVMQNPMPKFNLAMSSVERAFRRTIPGCFWEISPLLSQGVYAQTMWISNLFDSSRTTPRAALWTLLTAGQRRLLFYFVFKKKDRINRRVPIHLMFLPKSSKTITGLPYGLPFAIWQDFHSGPLTTAWQYAVYHTCIGTCASSCRNNKKAEWMIG